MECRLMACTHDTLELYCTARVLSYCIRYDENGPQREYFADLANSPSSLPSVIDKFFIHEATAALVGEIYIRASTCKTENVQSSEYSTAATSISVLILDGGRSSSRALVLLCSLVRARALSRELDCEAQSVGSSSARRYSRRGFLFWLSFAPRVHYKLLTTFYLRLTQSASTFLYSTRVRRRFVSNRKGVSAAVNIINIKLSFAYTNNTVGLVTVAQAKPSRLSRQRCFRSSQKTRPLARKCKERSSEEQCGRIKSMSQPRKNAAWRKRRREERVEESRAFPTLNTISRALNALAGRRKGKAITGL
uniref:Uncharacterized protein n=1 Tax=Trichogramma kaykai TaxID=54128 RepID=A0ABD2WIJ3_9HYME